MLGIILMFINLQRYHICRIASIFVCLSNCLSKKYGCVVNHCFWQGNLQFGSLTFTLS